MGLPLGVCSIGVSITDDVLKEDLEDTTGLLIDTKTFGKVLIDSAWDTTTNNSR